MRYLVIGGNGFLGYGVVDCLVANKQDVICFSKDECKKEEIIPQVKYVIGDVWDTELLLDTMKNIDVVVDFLSTTMPNNNNDNLDDEINKTFKYYNYILQVTQKAKVKHYVFPSSGGAIYGNSDGGALSESNELNPITPYGVGKKIAEDILHFYNLKYGIAITVLRIANVYGSKLKRDKPQGVIDILIQKALLHEPFIVWNNALSSKRDFLFMEDFAEAVFLAASNYNHGQLRVFNVGSGSTHSLKHIINLVEKETSEELSLVHDKAKESGVTQIILSIEKIEKCIGWYPKTTLEEGIKKTIALKKELLKNS